jgi:hypothetical protein
MQITIDPNTYALFERIIREKLETATSIRARLEGTRANGSTFTYHQELWPNEFDRIPWGEVDAILEAHWYPAGRPERRFTSSMSYLLPEFMHVRVSLDSFNNGISIDINDTHWNPRTVRVGVKGAMVPRYDRECIVCETDDQLVATVHELIESIFEDYESDKASHAYDELYYGDTESRFDPLDERNYPLDER